METPWMSGCVTKQALDICSWDRRVRAVKSRSEPYLSLDLCTEILSRLPVKSLLRFRCVSRSWRSLIDDPQFCSLHYCSFKNNSHETHLFIPQIHENTHDFSLSSLILSRETLEKTKLAPAWSGMDTPEAEGWYLHFAIDGLVLLINGHKEAMLWNPSIRRCRRLPCCVPLDFLGQIGIGFDPVSKDHKYVQTFYREGDARQRVAVYSVLTNSWKTRRIRAQENPSWTSPDWGQQPVSFKGSLYKTRKNKMLVEFSLSKEAFARQSRLPLVMSDRRIRLGLAVVDGGSTLAAIGRPWWGPGDCIIWALETTDTDTDTDTNYVAARWTKRYTVRMSFVRLLFHPKDEGGNAVFLRTVSGTGVFKMVSYNFKTHERRILQHKCCKDTLFAAPYKESLVLLN